MKAEDTGDPLTFYATPEHECSYLPQRQATTLFADPRFPKDIGLYTMLSRNGFRRSGEHIYRPHCSACQACIPIRVPVDRFTPKRSQRRAWNRNRDIYVNPCEPRIRDEHFALYQRYLHFRHRGGGMDNPTREQYVQFLTSVWSETIFHEFRCQGRLMAVCVTDTLLDGLSAVYTYFDPDVPQRSLGVYTVLWQIEEARRCGKQWLYLGYLIHASPKMSYKSEYQPQEHFINNQWTPDTHSANGADSRW